MREVITPPAAVQAALDLTQAAAEADGLLREIDAQDRDLGAKRLRLGRLLRDVRRQFPASGPKAGGWAKFYEKCGLKKDSALRYIALVDHFDAHPDEDRSPGEVYAGIVLAAKDSSHRATNPYPAQAAPAPGPLLFAAQQAAAAKPLAGLPKTDQDLWERACRGTLTKDEAQYRGLYTAPEQLDAEVPVIQAWRKQRDHARKAGMPEPAIPLRPIAVPQTRQPSPPPSREADAAQDARTAARLQRVQELAAEDARDSAPRTRAELAKALGLLWPQDRATQDTLYSLYCSQRDAAREPAEEPPPVYQPLFAGGVGAELAGLPLAQRAPEPEDDDEGDADPDGDEPLEIDPDDGCDEPPDYPDDPYPDEDPTLAPTATSEAIQAQARELAERFGAGLDELAGLRRRVEELETQAAQVQQAQAERDAAVARAEAAERERDAARAEVARLQALIDCTRESDDAPRPWQGHVEADRGPRK